MAPAYRRLSTLPLWRAQRRFYETAGIEAWRKGTVPHHVTNSVALAHAYAQVVCAFAEDAPSRRPLHVVELGAGPGRFAFRFLRAITRLGPAAPIHYVMTDVAPATIEFWTRHPAFAPYRRERGLDFAGFDGACDTTLTLRRTRREITPVSPLDRLVVIANYVFSGLPQDAFVSRAGRSYEWLLRPASSGRRPDTMALKGRSGARAGEPYDDADLNRTFAEASRRSRGLRLFPVGALRGLERLSRLARHDTLVLVADRPDSSDGLEATTLGIGRHGAVSFPVNLAALRRWARLRGGAALRPSQRARHLATTGLLLGSAPHDWAHTRIAWHRALAGGGPDVLYRRRRALASARRPTLRSLLALLRESGPDPRVMSECLPALWPQLPDTPHSVREELHEMAVAAWANHYEVGEPHDAAFDLGLLLYAVHAWDDARELFEASLASHGDDPATHWNLGLCRLALGKPTTAMRSFKQARVQAPGLNAAGPITVKLARRVVGPGPRVYARP